MARWACDVVRVRTALCPVMCPTVHQCGMRHVLQAPCFRRDQPSAVGDQVQFGCTVNENAPVRAKQGGAVNRQKKLEITRTTSLLWDPETACDMSSKAWATIGALGDDWGQGGGGVQTG